jgi:hypothetical protein
MKAATPKYWLLALASIVILHTAVAQSSGRVVINEYMPWTSNGCGTTSEFVELMNFGPGPVDIGCYVLTTGQYSITIPPNTLLQPGEFYVLAGRNFIPKDCANVDSAGTGINADLNWNTCNCTNVPIPTTGDGMMTDGGTSNTPLVLLNDKLSIIDAVVRSLPSEPATTITTSSVGGACSPQTFNIDQLTIVYEQLGMSAGRGNSFARVRDGDCGWLKDPQQSGNASNNRSGRESDITYSFAMVEAVACSSAGGRVDIYVEHMDISSLFPMNYTLSTDINGNGVFDMDDSYVTMIDSTAPFIEVKDLPIGRYRLTVSSKNGCYLETFEFSILPCEPVLPVQLDYFRYTNQHQLEWKLHGAENLRSMMVEKATSGGGFANSQTVPFPDTAGTQSFVVNLPHPGPADYRLRLTTKSGRQVFSPVVHTGGARRTDKIWPNPTTGMLHLQLGTAQSKNQSYVIHSSAGKVVKEGFLNTASGQTSHALDLSDLPPGIYHLQLTQMPANHQPISFRFVKH